MQMKDEGTLLPEPKYMMATKAFHQLGEISNPTPDICVVRSETETDYYGNWVFGLGFFGVRFPKETTRELNEAEIQEFNGQGLAMVGAFSGKHSYDCGKIEIK
jgi:hypothetical protein